MLVREVAPLIYGAIGRGVVRAIGAEDREELAQDCLAMAATQLDSAERHGKPFTPGTIAYYAIKSAKSGRRSTGASRTDAMAPSTQLCGRTSIQSMDEPVTLGEEGVGCDDAPSLHDMLACAGEDTALAAGRHLDWERALSSMNARQSGIVLGTAMGLGVNEMADSYRVSAPRVIQIRHEAGTRIAQAWGSNGLADSLSTPDWKRGMRALTERREGRQTRRAALAQAQ